MTADDRLEKLIWGYARRFPAQDRWDLVQEGLLAVLQARRAGRAADTQSAYDVAHSRICNRRRSEARDRNRRHRYLERRRAVDRSVPGERADVPAYMDALLPRERLAVGLRLWDGLSEAEAAAASDITTCAHQNLYTRALRRLRKRFAP